jgi:hypothetical protein
VLYTCIFRYVHCTMYVVLAVPLMRPYNICTCTIVWLSITNVLYSAFLNSFCFVFLKTLSCTCTLLSLEVGVFCSLLPWASPSIMLSLISPVYQVEMFALLSLDLWVI